MYVDAISGLVTSYKTWPDLQELTHPITGYNPLVKAKESADYPGDSDAPDSAWEDKELQSDVAEHMKASVFFEQRVSACLPSSGCCCCAEHCLAHAGSPSSYAWYVRSHCNLLSFSQSTCPY